MLGRGDQVPHVRVTTLEGAVLDYSTVWQHRNLLLVALSPEALPADAGVHLEWLRRACANREIVFATTRDVVPGLPPPAVLVADRWGEVVHVAYGSAGAPLPDPDDLVAWLDYVERRCPECEGETR